MSYFGALESRFIAQARLGNAYCSQWSNVIQAATGTGFMVDPGAVDRIISHIVISVAPDADPFGSRLEWGWSDATTGYTSDGTTENMKSDGGAFSGDQLKDAAIAVSPDRLIGSAQVTTLWTGEHALAAVHLFPVGGFLDATDHFVVLFEAVNSGTPTIDVAIYHYDA